MTLITSLNPIKQSCLKTPNKNAQAIEVPGLNALLADPATYGVQGIFGDISIINTSGKHDTWGNLRLLQFARNLYGIDGSGIRFELNQENLPAKLKSFFADLDQNFQRRIHKPKIAILDYGSQYTGNIASYLRKCGLDQAGVDVEFFDQTTSYDELSSRIDSGEIKGIVISGGPESVYDPKSPQVDPKFFTEGKIPVLGICYGMQAMAHALGGSVRQGIKGEYGLTQINYKGGTLLTKGVSTNQKAIMSHRDSVDQLPAGFELLASTDELPIAAMANSEKKLYAVQFHPEKSPGHEVLLKNFAEAVCGMSTTQNHYDQFIEEISQQIKDRVGDDHVFLALSGGVDSTVAAQILQKAIPGQVHFCLVDHGFMRAGEVDGLRQRFRKSGLEVEIIDASEKFFDAIKDINEPEIKRKKIGAAFIDVFAAKIEELNGKFDGKIKFLGQGTILSDVMESGKKRYDAESGQLIRFRDAVKSHHNVGGLPSTLADLELMEPLRDLFKDEVRIVGKKLGIDQEILARKPFPGPGLAIRIPNSAVTSKGIEKVRKADDLFNQEIKKSSSYTKVWQSLAALLTDTIPTSRNYPIYGDVKNLPTINKLSLEGYDVYAAEQPTKVVGTKGDERSYAKPVSISIRYRANERVNLNNDSKINIDVLRQLAQEITNATNANRVLYEISSDDKVNDNEEGIVMRAVSSEDAMTATATDVLDVLEGTAKKIQKATGVKRVYYDITGKPPSTIEFE